MSQAKEGEAKRIEERVVNDFCLFRGNFCFGSWWLGNFWWYL